MGTTVSFTCAVLPAKEGDKVHARSFSKRLESQKIEKNKREHPLAGVRVLVADNNESLRQHFSSLLQCWGCIVTTVPDAMSVVRELKLALANESPYDILLLDYHV